MDAVFGCLFFKDMSIEQRKLKRILKQLKTLTTKITSREMCMSDLTIKRRSLLKSVSMAAVGGQALLRTGNLQAAVDEATRSVESWPQMEYRELGKTGFQGSRLVFGCGAALSNGQANDLLEPALASGINVFDVGFRSYYRDAEMNLAPFLKKHQDEIFLISKAIAGDISAEDELSVAEAKTAANNWLKALDASLSELQVDHVDAYYLMAANNVSLIRSEEIQMAFDAVSYTHLTLPTTPYV